MLAGVLQQSGIAERVEQARHPGVAHAGRTADRRGDEPTSIAADGTMFVRVTTNAWMNELSLMEPELLRALNATEGRAPVKRIRWLLRRD